MPTNPDDLATPIISGVDGVMNGGLTKREYFAAFALQGLLANAAYDADVHTDEFFADSAVEYADDLILSLNQPISKPDQPQS